MSSLSDREDNSYSIVGYKVVMLDSDRVCAMSRCTNLLYSFIRLSNSLSIIEELNKIKMLNNSYLINVHDIVLGTQYDKEYIFIIVDDFQYISLRAFRTNSQQKSLSKNILLQFLSTVVYGILELHEKRITHRNITPDNIFYNSSYGFKIGLPDISIISDSIYYSNYREEKTYHPDLYENRSSIDMIKMDICSIANCLFYLAFESDIFINILELTNYDEEKMVEFINRSDKCDICKAFLTTVLSSFFQEQENDTLLNGILKFTQSQITEKPISISSNSYFNDMSIESSAKSSSGSQECKCNSISEPKSELERKNRELLEEITMLRHEISALKGELNSLGATLEELS